VRSSLVTQYEIPQESDLPAGETKSWAVTNLRNQKRLELFLLFTFLLSLPLLNPWIRGDGVGYYAYARAPLIEHRLDFTHDYQRANDSFRQDRLDSNGMPRPFFLTRTAHLENHFTVGPALLWSPFLIAAHIGVLLARVLGSSVAADGFSLPYRISMALGTGIYGFLALLLSFKLARRFVHPTWAFLATIAIWWGSSLPVYMYFNPSWSHAHSAFAVSLFLWYWVRTQEHRSLSQWLILGLIAGLMLNVYYANIMVLSVLAVEAVGHYAKLLRPGTQRGSNIWRLLIRHAAFGVVVVLTLIPTFISRWVVYGGPFETGYISLRDFLWRSPVFFSVLFSSNHGLLSWTPLVGLAILGLLLFMFGMPKEGIPFFAALVAFYFFITIYPDWAGISSFGNRFFVSLTPLFVLGLAYFLERVAVSFPKRSVAIGAFSGVMACFVLWNLGLIYQFGTHLIPVRGPISFREAAYNQFHVVPVRMTSDLHSYLFGRSQMMRQIEQKDIEQMNGGRSH
jgi:hypothetical protein